jgi:hypothetical protein
MQIAAAILFMWLIPITLSGIAGRRGRSILVPVAAFLLNDDGDGKMTAIWGCLFDGKDAKKGRKFQKNRS